MENIRTKRKSYNETKNSERNNRKEKIKEPKLNTQQAESAEFQETDDAHCIEAARAAENAEKMGGVPHWGLFLS